jgi:hypothetical protein
VREYPTEHRLFRGAWPGWNFHALCSYDRQDEVHLSLGRWHRLFERLNTPQAWALGIVLLLFLAPVVLLLWFTAVPGVSWEGPLPPLTAAQRGLAAALEADVRTIAAHPHNSAHPAALEEVAGHIEHELAKAGYRVHRQAFSAGGANVRNIEVVIEPAKQAASTLVLGAHYDSYYEAPGANDNGTGVAAVMALARNLVDLRGHSALRLRLVLFANEEPPWFQKEGMGSLVYARRLARSGEPVMGMISFETLGFYDDRAGSQHYPAPLDLLYPKRGNFVAFVGLTSSRGFVRSTIGRFRQLASFPSEGGTAPGLIPGIGWSDHWSFDQVGIPALMVTDTAPFRYRFYHSSGDTAKRIDFERLALVVSGMERVIRSWGEHPPQ